MLWLGFAALAGRTGACAAACGRDSCAVRPGFEHAKAEADRVRRTGRGASAAADALRRLRGFDGIDVHRADARALAAAHALALIHRQAVKRDLVE